MNEMVAKSIKTTSMMLMEMQENLNVVTLFKVPIIGILEEIDSFSDQKCTSWKCDKKFGQGPPGRSSPPHLDKIQKNSRFILFSGSHLLVYVKQGEEKQKFFAVLRQIIIRRMLIRPFLFSGELAGKPVDRGGGAPPTSRWLVVVGRRPWHLGQGGQVSPSGKLPGPSQLQYLWHAWCHPSPCPEGRRRRPPSLGLDPSWHTLPPQSTLVGCGDLRTDRPRALPPTCPPPTHLEI